jgi:hypothetical protein
MKEFLHPLYHQQNAQTRIEKPSLFPILTAEALLNEQTLQHILKTVEADLSIPPDVFEDLYLGLIEHYTESVQSLPNMQYSAFEVDKGQLLVALLRANLALEISEKYAPPPLPPENKTPFTKTDPRKIEKRMAVWQFAIFSSALLCDIGSLFLRMEVTLCTQTGEHPKSWHPFQGTMREAADKATEAGHGDPTLTHYHTQTWSVFEKKLGSKLNILLARQLIPPHVYEWLFSEIDIFLEWLGVLEDESTGSGTLANLMQTAARKLMNDFMGIRLPTQAYQLEKPMANSKLEEPYSKHSFWKGVEHALRGRSISNPMGKETPGKIFLEWLKQGIQNKKNPVNTTNAHVHLATDGAFLLYPEIFIDFCNAFPRFRNWVMVFKQFNHLGITKKSGGGSFFAKFFWVSSADIEARQGIIIEDPKILFDDHTIPSPSPLLQNPQSAHPNQNIPSIYPRSPQSNGHSMRLRHLLQPKLPIP